MSPLWILLELRKMEVVATTGAIGCAKLQSNCHHQHTITELLGLIQAKCHSCPNQQCQSAEGRKYHVLRTCSLQPHLGFSHPCLDHKGSLLPFARVAEPLISALTSVPHWNIRRTTPFY